MKLKVFENVYKINVNIILPNKTKEYYQITLVTIPNVTLKQIPTIPKTK